MELSGSALDAVNTVRWRLRHLTGTRDWSTGRQCTWVEEYWASRWHPHRDLIVQTVDALGPFQELVELGCNCGPNLYRIAERHPGVRLRGFDLNKHAIEYGVERFAEEQLGNVKITCAPATILRSLPTAFVDIVLTDAILIYTSPRRCRSILDQAWRVARRGLVLCELGLRDRAPDRVFWSEGCWLRSYEGLLSDIVGDTGQITVHMLTEAEWPSRIWKQFGQVVSVRRHRAEGAAQASSDSTGEPMP